jgi:N-carbamoylputrescine amidase
VQDLRIALVQMASQRGDVSANLDRIASLTEAAASMGAGIVCFPELSVTGYGRTAAMRRLAEPIPGPSSRRLEAIAGETGVTVLAGLLETGPSGAVWNTHLACGPGPLRRYRKTHVPLNERPAFDAGDARLVVEHASARYAVEICYDAHFPELTSALALDGAEVIFMPHASAGGEGRAAKVERWMRFLPARAYDNGVFVAVCNASGTTVEGEVLPGISFVLDPLGRLLASGETEGEEILVADLPAASLASARGDPNGFFLDQLRPSVYRAPAEEQR